MYASFDIDNSGLVAQAEINIVSDQVRFNGLLKIFAKQENILVGCVPSASVAITRCQFWGGVYTRSYPPPLVNLPLSHGSSLPPWYTPWYTHTLIYLPLSIPTPTPEGTW